MVVVVVEVVVMVAGAMAEGDSGTTTSLLLRTMVLTTGFSVDVVVDVAAAGEFGAGAGVPSGNTK